MRLQLLYTNLLKTRSVVPGSKSFVSSFLHSLLRHLIGHRQSHSASTVRSTHSGCCWKESHCTRNTVRHAGGRYCWIIRRFVESSHLGLKFNFLRTLWTQDEASKQPEGREETDEESRHCRSSSGGFLRHTVQEIELDLFPFLGLISWSPNDRRLMVWFRGNITALTRQDNIDSLHCHAWNLY